MSRVENDGRELAHDGERAHVDHKIVVAEARSALSHKYAIVSRRPAFLDYMLHVPGRNELALLYVDRALGHGSGDHEIIDAGPSHVLVHRADGRSGSTLFVHNLADRPCTLQLRSQRDAQQRPLNFIADSDYGPDLDLDTVDVAGYGYRWIRLRRTPGS